MKLRGANYKSHWNILVFCDQWKLMSDQIDVPWKNVWYCFIHVVWVHFSHKTEKFWFWEWLKYFNTFLIKKDIVSDLNMPHGKMSYFVSFLLFAFTVVTKLRNFDFESHWNTLIFFDKKTHGVIFEYVPRKNVLICFIFIVWLHFSHKTEQFRFWKSLKYFNIFW